MKMIKMALLGGAALAVSSMAAQADDLTALKAQIESLNARVASMEAAPSVPTGYSLLTVSDGQAHVVPGMTREELLNGNAAIVRAKISEAAKHSPNAVIVIFANPMDAMCHVAMKASGFPRERVIGQGGALDSARYRYFVADALGVSAADVHGFVIGGHTDTTMVPVVSQTRTQSLLLTSGKG